MTADPGPVRPAAVLIGPMAAGKTSVGRHLARLWHVPFADLDRVIEERSGCTIPELFAARGEDAFRELEAQTLRELLREHRGVLSLGGGAPLAPANREALQGHAVVLLEIDESAAADRLRGGRGRPLLSGRDPVLAWRGITHRRMPVYRELARYRVDAAHRSSAAVARALVRMLPAPAPDSAPSSDRSSPSTPSPAAVPTEETP